MRSIPPSAYKQSQEKRPHTRIKIQQQSKNIITKSRKTFKKEWRHLICDDDDTAATGADILTFIYRHSAS